MRSEAQVATLADALADYWSTIGQPLAVAVAAVVGLRLFYVLRSRASRKRRDLRDRDAGDARRRGARQTGSGPQD